MLSQNKIKVLVVDDSAFMRKVITDIINSDPNLEVIGVARDGIQAIELANKLKPDVITLDVEMPKMDGLSALKKILEKNTVPIIMLSSVTFSGSKATIEALELGAVDFITKPGGSISLNIHEIKDDIIKKVYIATKVNLTQSYKQNKIYVPIVNKPKIYEQKEENLKWLVTIGTSTGGPKALNQLITKLPNNLPAAFLVVQHMPPGFTKSLADRLNSLSELTVKEAEQGDEIKPGHVYVAPGDQHMQVLQSTKLQIQLTKDSPVNGHRPSVDVLFNSVSKVKDKKLVAVIMTGMGYDGSKGIISLKSAGSYNIGEAAETCVVYGMPKAAKATDCIDIELPLFKIHQKIKEIIN